MDVLGLDSAVNASAFKSFHNLTPRVREHLALVYRTLLYAVLTATLGCVLERRVLPASPFVALLASFAPLFLLPYLNGRAGGDRPERRAKALALFAALEGYSIGPLVGVALDLDEFIVLQALGGVAVIFACFSLSALCAERRAYLYLGGLLGSATTVLFWCALANLLWHTSWNTALQLYGGLMLFTAYVLYDTQLIIERAFAGVLDHVHDSALLFTDLFAMFWRLLVIFMRRAEQRQGRERRSGRARRRTSRGGGDRD